MEKSANRLGGFVGEEGQKRVMSGLAVNRSEPRVSPSQIDECFGDDGSLGIRRQISGECSFDRTDPSSARRISISSAQ
jgi:hypothetical protein